MIRLKVILIKRQPRTLKVQYLSFLIIKKKKLMLKILNYFQIKRIRKLKKMINLFNLQKSPMIVSLLVDKN